MRAATKRTRNLVVVFSLSVLVSGFALPRVIRRAIEPTAFAAAKTFTVNVTGDGQDANIGDGICQTSVAGNCSLRAAIQEANADAGTDTINFQIPGAGVTPSALRRRCPTSPTPLSLTATASPARARTRWRTATTRCC